MSDSIRVQQVAGTVDIAQEVAQRDLALQKLDREYSLVGRLHSAIDRITTQNYGICPQCGGEIALTLLKAILWAELCIQCQEKAEHLESRTETRRG